ncbi:MAG TPA: SURF1 family protein [Longimicrobiales bacterium]|nr:SURF1 family protein [Longimicrobiales bacterium]
MLIVVSVCVRLGFWQVDRLQQRQTRNQLQRTRAAAPPFRVGGLSFDTAGMLYHRVWVEGRYDHDRSIVLPGRSLRGVPGVHLLTPLLLGGGSAVLVNRGWVPAADGATVNLDSLRVPVTERVTGLALPFPGSGRIAVARTTDAFQRVWFSPNEAALRSQFPYKLLAIQVQALPDSATPLQAIPVRLGPPELDNGPHLGYAIQWFSFGAIFFIGWISLMIRKGEIRRGPARST